MIEILQSKNKGKIIICNSGNFYIAVGKDAVLLNRILGLKVNCLKLEICKVGFPIIALEKYISKTIFKTISKEKIEQSLDIKLNSLQLKDILK